MPITNDQILTRTEAALAAIKSSYGTDEGENGTTLFVVHHIEEIGAEYWKKHLGSSKPKPRQILNLLVLRSHWDDDNVFDFTLPDDVTDYVISVRFNKAGAIKEITMEG
ncbi:DUF2004 domain-containing protein [Pokkaliibacter sp. MBI-7]|uniref:DUF2004 domain-containing protein n=1 Tax=Pokkaliibacter sp. MBI-7 TaxID=3040600 RepID=UPI002446CCE8|nr:DUF2004 domain-containing protein [Pokkaliibacter sp. MBI-7]MDH2434611.1 DUF2004 domain-containing protein [Pokkaliibacter sp. MBI-7]